MLRILTKDIGSVPRGTVVSPFTDRRKTICLRNNTAGWRIDLEIESPSRGGFKYGWWCSAEVLKACSIPYIEDNV
jgi:hypothetical protein